MNVHEWDWQLQTWNTPDGKRVPYHLTDVTRLVIPNAPQLAEIDTSNFEDWPLDGPDVVRVEVSRWPRKYKVAVVIETLEDGGMDIENLHTAAVIIRMGDYALEDFETNAAAILQRVREYLKSTVLA